MRGLSKIAANYTSALWKQAMEAGVLDHVYQDIQRMQEACTTHPTLLSVLQDPLVQKERRLKILQTASRGLQLTTDFFQIALQKKREGLLVEIMENFQEQYLQYIGTKRATVTTAHKLSAPLRKQLITAAKRMSACQDVVLTEHTDPSLIGGYRLELEGKQIDESISNKMALLRERCMSSVAIRPPRKK